MGNCLKSEQNHPPIPFLLKLSSSICKISLNDSLKEGTGFFINFFPDNSFKCLITEYNLISEKNKDIQLEIHNKNNIKLVLDRSIRFIKFFKEPLDITVIQILNEDLELMKNVSFLDYDKNYIDGYNQYKNEKIFSLGYPSGDELEDGNGKILTAERSNFFFKHNIPNNKGSIGSPIFLLSSSKLIGVYRSNQNQGIFIGIIVDIIKNIDIKESMQKFKNDNINIQVIFTENKTSNKVTINSEKTINDLIKNYCDINGKQDLEYKMFICNGKNLALEKNKLIKIKEFIRKADNNILNILVYNIQNENIHIIFYYLQSHIEEDISPDATINDTINIYYRKTGTRNLSDKMFLCNGINLTSEENKIKKIKDFIRKTDNFNLKILVYDIEIETNSEIISFNNIENTINIRFVYNQVETIIKINSELTVRELIDKFYRKKGINKLEEHKFYFLYGGDNLSSEENMNRKIKDIYGFHDDDVDLVILVFSDFDI